MLSNTEITERVYPNTLAGQAKVKQSSCGYHQDMLQGDFVLFFLIKNTTYLTGSVQTAGLCVYE